MNKSIHFLVSLIVEGALPPHSGNLFGTPRTQSTMKRGAPTEFPEYLKAIDKKKIEDVRHAVHAFNFMVVLTCFISPDF